MPQRKKTLGIVELLEMFPDEASARKWFEEMYAGLRGSVIVCIAEV